MTRACSTHGREKFIQHFVRKIWTEDPLGRLWRRWENTIRMDLREIGWEGEDWIHLAQDRNQW
jgi:hypothetical protein